MFFGTTPAIISQFLEKEIKEHNPKKVWVLFSGNFVVEQITGKVLPECPIEATDISLYSKAIGHGVTDKEFGLVLNKEIAKEFPVLAKQKTPLEKAASVIFLTEVAPMFKKAEKAEYYKNLVRDAKSGTQGYLDKIKGKLERFSENVKHMNFHGVDACSLVNQVKKGDLVFYDPPVLLGDYEKMFAPVEACYTYPPEPYTQMTDEVKVAHLEHFNKIGATCYYRTNNPLEKSEIPKGYVEVFRYQYKYGGHYCVYTNRPLRTFVGTFQPLKEEARNYKMIDRSDEITEKSEVKVIPVKGTIANHYRLLWVKKATMTDGGRPYLITVDDKLIGMVQVADSVQFGTELAVIFSDPSCPHSRYKRLSKLVLYITCTQEFLRQFNDVTMWEHKGFTTRVFTNAPVSMKYRGMFDLVERIEEPDGNYKFKLAYQNRKNILPTYQDGLEAWLKKDAKHTH